ncbi:unnamed protein product, partial [Porites evermanni]
FLAASGLKCYQCGPSTTSLADCAKSQNELDCKGSEPRCFTLTTEFKVGSQESKSYTKSCTTKAVCDVANSGVLKPCKDAGGKCEYKCCDKDLCNGDNSPVNSGSTPIVSIILMVSCASVGFFCFF